jgi:hypothetical protein
VGRVTEHESRLAGEQDQVPRLKKELAGARSATVRVEELESMRTHIARVTALEQMLPAEQQTNKGISLSPLESELDSQQVQNEPPG